MAEQGARVVIASRKQEACQAVVDAITSAYGDGPAIAVAANISSKEALRPLVSETNTRLGPVDILVCNAASNPYYGPLGSISDEQFRKVLDNNILSDHWLVQLTAPQMIERTDGAIIFVSSIGGLKGSPVIGAYNVSKAADMQLARNDAVEYGRHNVRVNCIAPGLIRTDFARASDMVMVLSAPFEAAYGTELPTPLTPASELVFTTAPGISPTANRVR